MPKSSFFSPRRLALLAMLTAASIVLSRLCVIYLTPTFRVEFGNLPIFLAGLFLGPASGVIVGGLADVLGATLSGVVYCPPVGTGQAELLEELVPDPAGRCAGQNAVDDVLAHGAVWHRLFAAAGCAGAAVSWRLAG